VRIDTPGATREAAPGTTRAQGAEPGPAHQFLPGRLGARYTPAGDDRTWDEATVELTTLAWGWLALLQDPDVTLPQDISSGWLDTAIGAPPRQPSVWPWSMSSCPWNEAE
jgi:hypothetical protein